MNITEEEFAVMKARVEKAGTKRVALDCGGSVLVEVDAPKKRPPAHTPGRMNKTEAAYATLLDARKLAGEITRWEFERITLKIGSDCRLTPDFWVVLPNGHQEFYETKGGYSREDAIVKLKSAATQFPEFTFHLARRIKTQWITQEVGRA